MTEDEIEQEAREQIIESTDFSRWDVADEERAIAQAQLDQDKAQMEAKNTVSNNLESSTQKDLHITDATQYKLKTILKGIKEAFYCGSCSKYPKKQPYGEWIKCRPFIGQLCPVGIDQAISQIQPLIEQRANEINLDLHLKVASHSEMISNLLKSIKQEKEKVAREIFDDLDNITFGCEEGYNRRCCIGNASYEALKSKYLPVKLPNESEKFRQYEQNLAQEQFYKEVQNMGFEILTLDEITHICDECKKEDCYERDCDEFQNCLPEAQYQKDIKEFIEWIEEHRQIDFQGDLWGYTIKPCELDELKKSLE